VSKLQPQCLLCQRPPQPIPRSSGLAGRFEAGGGTRLRYGGCRALDATSTRSLGTGSWSGQGGENKVDCRKESAARHAGGPGPPDGLRRERRAADRTGPAVRQMVAAITTPPPARAHGPGRSPASRNVQMGLRTGSRGGGGCGALEAGSSAPRQRHRSDGPVAAKPVLSGKASLALTPPRGGRNSRFRL